MMGSYLVILYFICWKLFFCQCNPYNANSQTCTCGCINAEEKYPIEDDESLKTEVVTDNTYMNYIYNLAYYFWELLGVYHDQTKQLEDVLDKFHYKQQTTEEDEQEMNIENPFNVKTHEEDGKQPVYFDDLNKSNLLPSESSNRNEDDTVDLYYSTVDGCVGEEVTSLPVNNYCRSSENDRDMRDMMARLRLVGLSFLDMGHLLLQDDPRYPIIPKGIKNNEYIYPPADN